MGLRKIEQGLLDLKELVNEIDSSNGNTKLHSKSAMREKHNKTTLKVIKEKVSLMT